MSLSYEKGSALLRLGIVLRGRGRLLPVSCLVTGAEETLRLDPNHPASLLSLGRIKLYVQRDIEGGLTMWERLIDVASGTSEAAGVVEELEALKSAHPGS